MWAFMGMGYSMKNFNGNYSPYLQVENIDPKWLEAVGSSAPKTNRMIPIGAWREHRAVGATAGATEDGDIAPVAERAKETGEHDLPGQNPPV